MRAAASRRRMYEPVRHAADDDAPFSESMLEWLEEGDRMGEARPGAPRPSGAHHVTEPSPRRGKIIIGAAVVLGLGFVVGLKIISARHKEEAPAELAIAPRLRPNPPLPPPAPPAVDPSAPAAANPSGPAAAPAPDPAAPPVAAAAAPVPAAEPSAA
ncbi:MAG TPA: hypothetical protein VHJ20_19970, partial [Polyangia bacterium]|nr:hypothetical protein [Polyangia bacterium]